MRSRCVIVGKIGAKKTLEMKFVEVDNFTTIMFEHEKDIQDSECRRGHGKEVDRYQVFNMIIEKVPPRLRWRLRMMDHVFCDCRLGDVDAEQLKFAVNTMIRENNSIYSAYTDPSILC